MKGTVRTFVAVELNDTIRACAEELTNSLADADVNVKWVDPADMHLTLVFLGDVPTTETPEVCKAVERGAAKVEPFELEIRQAGAFPNTRRPRTLWIGAGSGEEQMVSLHDAIENELVHLGFGKERRRFHPHLTIGRVRKGGPGMADLGSRIEEKSDFAAGWISVRQVVVFSSELTPSGPIYEPLGRARVGG